MLFGHKETLALIALLQLVLAGDHEANNDLPRRHAHHHHANDHHGDLHQRHADVHLDRRNVKAYLTQEVLEVVEYVATVWVQPPTPSTTSSSSTTTPSSTTPSVVYTTPSPPPPAPTTTSCSTTTSSQQAPPPAPTTSSTTPAAQPTQASGGGGSSPYGSGPFSGQATYYAPGMGSCGLTSSSTDMICALAKTTMLKTSPANPNANPMCGRKIRVMSDSNPTGVELAIVDTCPGCAGAYDLDLSPAAFDQLGQEAAGVIQITWVFV